MRLLKVAELDDEPRRVLWGSPVARLELAERVWEIGQRLMREPQALVEYCRLYDGRERVEVFKQKDFEAAGKRLNKQLLGALESAKKAIESVSQAQMKSIRDIVVEQNGLVVETVWRPVERVGLYVPGGKAVLVSTLLMLSLPARMAGVGQIAVATPQPTDALLAAAGLCGVDALYAVGGAHAIFAFAFGIPPLPRVDMVAGPGGAYVTEAKRQVFGSVGVDLLAGPTELAIVAGRGADARTAAVELLAQLEHSPDARAVLFTAEQDFVAAVENEAARLLQNSGEPEWLLGALQATPAVLAEPFAAVRVINHLAPEHLLFLGDASALADKVHNCGAVSVGSPSVLVDYSSGANHTLPTGGSARFASAVSVHTFLHLQYRVRGVGEARDAARVAKTLASAEGLRYHALASLQSCD